MPFLPPKFNLTCNIWHSPITFPGPPDVVVKCNLAWGKRVAGYTFQFFNARTLLLPAGTDIRDAQTQQPMLADKDLVEVPAGSGRLYLVETVDDIGKGFPNEHRVAVLQATKSFGLWPIPMP